MLFRSPTSKDYLGLLDTQQQLLNETYAPRSAMIHSRKFLAWYSSGFPGCHEFRKKVFTLDDSETLWKEAREFFVKATEGRDLGFLSEPFLMGGHG